jgi:hypothetical protein
MVTERTLRQWRRDSLNKINNLLLITNADDKSINIAVLLEKELHERVIRLTGDLLDVHLMKGSKS